MIKATETPTTRRGLLAASGAIAILGPVGTAAAPASAGHPDAELIRVCAQHIHNVDAYNASDELDVLFDGGPTPLWSAYLNTRDFIDATEPLTIAGVLALAKAARHEATANLDGEEDWEGHPGEMWAPRIINALLRLHGEEAVALAPVRGTSTQPDAELIALAEEFVRLQAARLRVDWADDECEHRSGREAALTELRAIDGRLDAIGEAIIEATPRSLEGFRAKARAGVAWFGCTPLDDGVGGEILWALSTDLAGGA